MIFSQIAVEPPQFIESMRRSGTGGPVQDPVPWHVGIGLSVDKTTLDPFCSGTILDKDTILTARHCMMDFWFSQALFVLAGSEDITAPKKLHGVSKIIHPESVVYNDKTRENDVTIIKLKEPLKLSRSVQPACLPNHKLKMRDGKQCYIGGWGQVAFETPEPPFDLMAASEVSIFDLEKCNKSLHGTSYINGLTEDMICTYSNHKHACVGDSGGALICMEENQPVLSGIISNNHKCDKGKPVVYTRVDSFKDWIQSQMVNNSYKTY